jgi:hypothetical protein
MSTVFE